MAVLWCHEAPDLLEFETEIVATRPGAIALARSAFHPGGGGQVGDRGVVEWLGGSGVVSHVQVEPGNDGDHWWHVLEGAPDLEVPLGTVAVRIDGTHRGRVAALHTTSHVLNAFVFEEFAGALVTGAQINADGTGRMDFDLPEVDNDRLRALTAPVNDVIARGLEVRAVFVDAAEAARVDGLVRSLSVAPPPSPDGRLRVIEIGDLDRQACGGTHLTNTGQSPFIEITKIENKGRRNRRVRFRALG